MQPFGQNNVFGYDLLGCFALVLVLFSSLFSIVPNTQGIMSQLLSVAGILGIELFLILIGFLVGHKVYILYVSKNKSITVIGRYLVMFLLKIVLLYYAVLLLNIALSCLVDSEMPADLWSYFLGFQNLTHGMSSLFFIESWAVTLVIFSLIVGFFVLLVFSTLIPKFHHSRTLIWTITFVIGLGILAKLGFYLNDDVKSMIHWNQNLRQVVCYRLDTLFYGVLLAYLVNMYASFWRRMKYVLPLVGMVMLIVIHFLVPKQGLFIESYPLYWDVLYLPLNTIALLFLFPAFNLLHMQTKIQNTAINRLSAISYAVYLIHFSLVLGGLNYLFPTDNLPVFDSVVYIIVYISLLVLSGLVLHCVIEKPLKSRIRSFIQ